MKQKQVKAAPKNAKQTNLKKAAPPKKVAAPVKEEAEDEEEEEVVAVKKPANKKAAPVQKKVPPIKKVAAPVQEVVAAKKPANKKAAPVQKKVVQVVEEPEEEEDDDDDEEEEVDEVEDDEEMEDDEDQEDEEVEAMEEDGDEQDDEAEEEEDDDDDDDEDAEEEQEENDEDDEDEGPTEAPIDEEPTIPSKVKSGEIPAKVSLSKIIHVTKLPKKCKQIDIVEAFVKFGAIDQIHLVTTPSGTVANIAFKTIRAAEAASSVSKKIRVIDSPVEVTMKQPRKLSEMGKFNFIESRDRTVYVKYLKINTTEDQVKKHFAACGEIERCRVIAKHKITFAYVTFTEKECVKEALKLHNSVLNGGTIAVYESKPDKIVKLGERDRNLVIMLRNKQQLEALEGAVLEKIFSKCGKIDHMEVLCGKNVLAFIAFENEQAVEKALKMTGKKEEGIELEVEKYDGNRKKTGIYVSNLPIDCTAEELRQHFSASGEIKGVILKKNFAIIHFSDTDGYCKSFLLDESYFKKQMIFVEPLSARKQTLLKSKMAKILESAKGNRKRPFQNGNSVFKGKRPRME